MEKVVLWTYAYFALIITLAIMRGLEMKKYEIKIRECKWIDLKLFNRNRAKFTDKIYIAIVCVFFTVSIVLLYFNFNYLKEFPFNLMSILCFWLQFFMCFLTTFYIVVEILYSQHSVLNVADFLHRKVPFCLYLRSFNRDSKKVYYNGGGILSYHDNEKDIMLVRELLKMKINTVDILRIMSTKKDLYLYNCWFSENRLAKTIRLANLTLCSIGDPDLLLVSKTKSLRLYASQSTWQKDILKLCDFAESIYVLVSDSPGCIWELTNLQRYLDKICFIVDDIDIYNSIRKMNLSFELPFIKKEKLQRIVSKDRCYLPFIAIITYVNGLPLLRYIENTKTGYEVFKESLS